MEDNTDLDESFSPQPKRLFSNGFALSLQETKPSQYEGGVTQSNHFMTTGQFDIMSNEAAAVHALQSSYQIQSFNNFQMNEDVREFDSFSNAFASPNLLSQDIQFEKLREFSSLLSDDEDAETCKAKN